MRGARRADGPLKGGTSYSPLTAARGGKLLLGRGAGRRVAPDEMLTDLLAILKAAAFPRWASVSSTSFVGLKRRRFEEWKS